MDNQNKKIFLIFGALIFLVFILTGWMNANRNWDNSRDQQILDVRTAPLTGPADPAPCPKCGSIMQRAHYDSSVHLIIDRCLEHGVWLDTGEIKKVQALAEKSAGIHCMLVKKLGLG